MDRTCEAEYRTLIRCPGSASPGSVLIVLPRPAIPPIGRTSPDERTADERTADVKVNCSCTPQGMPQTLDSDAPGLKATLKRGALITAANWPLVAVQFVAESTLKLLLAVPVVGGIFLVVLLLGANADELLAGDVREVVAEVFASMRHNIPALVAFSGAFTIVLLGGSALTFLVKGGTVSLLAAAEAQAGPVERPPVRIQTVRRANVIAIEPFLDGCRRLWRRYMKLGACLLGVYGVTAILYLGFVVGGLSLVGNSGVLLGWTVAAAAASSILIVWITLVNFFYLLTQMVMALEDVGVRNGMRRAFRFVRTSLREIAGIFGVVLLLATIATVASIMATAGFGLINLIPILGLAVLPLQIAAWLVRGFVFQYLALAALSAYLTQYRYYIVRERAAQDGQLLQISDALPGKRLA
jgi:hypothetical protein